MRLVLDLFAFVVFMLAASVLWLLSPGIPGIPSQDRMSALGRVRNRHTPIVQPFSCRRLFILIAPGVHADRFLKTVKPECTGLGLSKACFTGPSDLKNFIFSFATGYGLKPFYLFPPAVGIMGTGGLPSFLAPARAFDTVLCGSREFNDCFPEPVSLRDCLDNEKDAARALLRTLPSRLKAKRALRQLHICFLEPGDDETVKTLAKRFLASIKKDGGIFVLVAPRIEGFFDGMSRHSAFFFGKAVRPIDHKASEGLELQDITATLAYLLRIEQPAVCLGCPVSNLVVRDSRQRVYAIAQSLRENYSQIPLLAYKRFGLFPDIGKPNLSVTPEMNPIEAEYTAARAELVYRLSRRALLRGLCPAGKRDGTIAGRRFTARCLFALTGVLLILALLFSVSLSHSLLFILFYGASIVFLGTRLFSLRPDMAWLVLLNHGFGAFRFLLPALVLPVALWGFLGLRMKWNGASSWKLFFILSTLLLLVPAVRTYILLGPSDGPPPPPAFLVWSGFGSALAAMLNPLVFLVAGLVSMLLTRFLSVRRRGAEPPPEALGQNT